MSTSPEFISCVWVHVCQFILQLSYDVLKVFANKDEVSILMKDYPSYALYRQAILAASVNIKGHDAYAFCLLIIQGGERNQPEIPISCNNKQC